MLSLQGLVVVILFSASTRQSHGLENDDQHPLWQKSFEFKSLQLDNGLKLILIRDENATKAAASLQIGAGSLNEPPNVDGLAHLLEHLVFLGNRKYPEPEEFEKYASANGGSVTGQTDFDRTVYGISVLPDAIEGAVDQLFHLVDSPLLLDSAVAKEITVVNDEYLQNLLNDDYQYEQIQQATAKDGHPYRVFTTGSTGSLWTKPIQLGINITEEVIKFYTTYYSSNLMTLVVLGKHEIKDLESMVVPLFGKLVNRNATLVTWPNPPYKKSETGVKIELLPKSGLQQLTLEFPIPKDAIDIIKNYYVPLLSTPGPRSLYSFLLSKNYISKLKSKVEERYRGFQEFVVTLTLTDYGALHHEEAAVHVFEFINSLSSDDGGAQEWYWDEVKSIDDIKHRYKAKDDPYKMSANLAKKLILDDADKVLADYLSRKRIAFNATNITAALEYITPENLRMYFVSNKVTNTTELEPHYQVEYKVGNITQQLFNRMQNAKPNSNMAFPHKNPYIPSNFTVTELQPTCGCDTKNIPRALKSTNFSRIWYLNDRNEQEYRLPKVFIRVKMFIPFAYSTPVDAGLLKIIPNILNEVLSPVTGLAKLVGTEAKTNKYLQVYGFTIEIYGFNDGIDRLVEKVMETISNPKEFLTNETFHAGKEVYRTSLVKKINSQPVDIADVNILLRETHWENTQLFDVLDDITYEAAVVFYTKFISRIKMEWFLYGNIDEQKATKLVSSSEEFFIKQGSRPGLDAEYRWQIRNVQIPQGTNWFYKMKTKLASNLSCIEVSFQSEKPGLEDGVKVDFLKTLMETEAYLELRSKQQLGYHVWVGLEGDDGLELSYNLLAIQVQGEKDTDYVEGKINHFLLQYRETLKHMTQEEFSSRKLAQWKVWNTTETDIEKQGEKYWNEILHGHYNFERNHQKQEILNQLTLQELETFYDDFFGMIPGKQRRLSVHVVPEHVPWETHPHFFLVNLQTEITDPIAWKRAQYLFPTHGI